MPVHKFHGSTDGLILLRLARAALDIPPVELFARLDNMMLHMYSYINSLTDEEVAAGIDPLHGVLTILDGA